MRRRARASVTGDLCSDVGAARALPVASAASAVGQARGTETGARVGLAAHGLGRADLSSAFFVTARVRRRTVGPAGTVAG